MKDQVLSIEQIQKLKDLGVDISKASMCYVCFESDGSKYVDIVVHDESCYEMACMNPMPTFTLQDMIELMPSKVIIDYENYYLCVEKNCTAYLTVEKEALWFGKDNGILINTYDMLVWLAENKYI